ncbi:MAG TPA: VWA domain-containing protein, partial [Cyclobacteriaceae bacterium]|nr:VWA domain-containing protein [Cyclobacteriaceae bacterium]
GVFSRYPPVQVPFGKFSYPPNAQVLLYQQIGSVATDRPMLLSWEDNGRKVAAFIGDGLWKWRLDEFSTSEKTEIFDETFSKLIQYLSTVEDKRKFRFFPIQNEFTDSSPVIFESQVYNDLFEKIYGNKIDLKLTDEKGKTSTYNYTLSPGGERYRVGGLKEGAYRYTATTEINSKRESVSGQFLVKEQNIEPLNVVADFGLLRKLSKATGGKFYNSNNWNQLVTDFKKTEPKELIHSEESFNPLIHVKWFFFLLLLLISTEWFSRKYLGSY